MPLFWKSKVFLCCDLWVLLYHISTISWDCVLTHVLHCGECVIKYHMVLGGGRGEQFWFSKLGPLTLHKMGSVQCRIWYFPLVPIRVTLSSLFTVDTLGWIWYNPRRIIPLWGFLDSQPLTSIPVPSRPNISLGCYTAGMLPWIRKFSVWFSWTLVAVWWHAEGGSICHG